MKIKMKWEIERTLATFPRQRRRAVGRRSCLFIFLLTFFMTFLPALLSAHLPASLSGILPGRMTYAEAGVGAAVDIDLKEISGKSITEGKIVLSAQRNRVGVNLSGKKIRNAYVRSAGKVYYCNAWGMVLKGWISYEGHYYFLDRKTGALKGRGSVDGVLLSPNGAAKADAADLQKIQSMMRARTALIHLLSPTDSDAVKLKKSFDYIITFPYRRWRLLKPIMNSKGWESVFADDIFLRQSGCCVSDACAFAFMAKEIGYENVYVCDDTGHAWAEINGLVYDPLFAEAKNYAAYYGCSYRTYGLHPVQKRAV